MTVKDGIVFGIGFTIGKILITDLVNIGGVVMRRTTKKVNSDFAEYMDRVYPCEKNDNKNYPEAKAKIGFEI